MAGIAVPTTIPAIQLPTVAAETCALSDSRQEKPLIVSNAP